MRTTSRFWALGALVVALAVTATGCPASGGGGGGDGVQDAGALPDDAGIATAGGPDSAGATGLEDVVAPIDTSGSGTPDSGTPTEPLDASDPPYDPGPPVEEPCTGPADCVGDPGGPVCDPEFGKCVGCLSSADCVGDPAGGACKQNHTCGVAAGCSLFSECVGHPKGERCIVFEERCGECLDSSECAAPLICSEAFVCVPKTDAYCAGLEPPQVLLGDQCVACVADSQCAQSTWATHCGADHACHKCVADSQCTDPDLPKCNLEFGECGPCASNVDCKDVDKPFCAAWGCVACVSEQCPAATPKCDDGQCVECTKNSDCNPEGDEYCFEGACQFEATDCMDDSDCSGHAELTVCHETTKTCVQCKGNFDCDWNILSNEGCVVETGQCVDCTSDWDCFFGWDCNLATHQCVQCLSQADCEAGEYCGDDGDCASGCSTAADCPEGGVCAPQHYCTECLQDADCMATPGTPYCGPAQECVACKSDSQCAGNVKGGFCNTGSCSPFAPDDCYAWGSCQLAMATYICGVYPDGCGGTLDCGQCGAGECVDGGKDCACPLDPQDTEASNDTFATATELVAMTDSPNSSFGSGPESIHSDQDTDWYVVHVDDGGFDGNPIIGVSLTVEQPEGGQDDSEYELMTWFDCDSGEPSDTECLVGKVAAAPTHGAPCSDDGQGWFETAAEVQVVTGCTGSLDDSGTLVVRVKKLARYGRCDSYRLAIAVK